MAPGYHPHPVSICENRWLVSCIYQWRSRWRTMGCRWIVQEYLRWFAAVELMELTFLCLLSAELDHISLELYFV